MSLTARWQRYWFDDQASLFDLAVVRVLAAGVILFMLLAQGYSSLSLSLGIADPLWTPIWLMKILAFGARPDDATVLLVYWVTVASIFALLVGFATNLAAMVGAVGHAYVTGYIYSFGHVHHPEPVMIFALVALALSPAGKVVSIDYLLYWRYTQPPGTAIVTWTDQRAAWALKFIMAFFALMYLSAVHSKIMRDGTWLNGFTLQWYLAKDGILHDSPLAVWLSTKHALILTIQYVVYFFQSTFWLAVIFPRLRWFYVPVGLAFHFGIYFTLRAPFFYWIVLYAAFIPWRHVVLMLSERIVEPARAPEVPAIPMARPALQ